MTASLVALQALVLYIGVSRHAPLEVPIASLLSLAIRAAMQLGLHQEERNEVRASGAFTTMAEKTHSELRRRLWWHILSLDVQIAEESGGDPTLHEGMWSCRMPQNLDDVELDFWSNLPLPPRAGETFNPDTYRMQENDAINAFVDSFDRRTDMSYALLRIEMTYAMRQFAFSEQFCHANRYKCLTTVPQRMQFLEKQREHRLDG